MLCMVLIITDCLWVFDVKDQCYDDTLAQTCYNNNILCHAYTHIHTNTCRQHKGFSSLSPESQRLISSQQSHCDHDHLAFS